MRLPLDTWDLLEGPHLAATFLSATVRAETPERYVTRRYQNRRKVEGELAAERAALLAGLAGLPALAPTRLTLILGEFEDLLPRLVDAIADAAWPRLTDLTIEIAGYDPVWMGADDEIQPLVTPAQADAFARALPALRRLTLVGHGFFPRLTHPTLDELRLEGHLPVLDGGIAERPRSTPGVGLTLPALTRFALVAMNPSSGCGPPCDASLLWFDPARLPALRHLELHESDLGDETDSGGVYETLARASILRQLRTLHLDWFDVWSDDPLPVIRKHARRFAHLERLLVDRPEPEAIPLFPNLVVLAEEEEEEEEEADANDEDDETGGEA